MRSSYYLKPTTYCVNPHSFLDEPKIHLFLHIITYINNVHTRNIENA